MGTARHNQAKGWADYATMLSPRDNLYMVESVAYQSGHLFSQTLETEILERDRCAAIEQASRWGWNGGRRPEA